jgi:hypothetical protein
MENWRRVWREGLVPELAATGLEALRQGLRNDDKELIQGSTTFPPPLQLTQDCQVAGACAVGYAGWKSENLRTVGEVEEFFARACLAADQRLSEPAGCRWFLNWYDETPRAEMRRILLDELNQVLALKQDTYQKPSSILAA